MPERIVIALGGNALQSGNSAPTAEAQLEVVKKTSERIAEISRRGYEMAVAHVVERLNGFLDTALEIDAARVGLFKAEVHFLLAISV